MRIEFSTLFFAVCLLAFPVLAVGDDGLDVFLDQHCAECHGWEDPEGQISLASQDGDSSYLVSYGSVLALVRDRLVSGEMPPKEVSTRPTSEEIDAAVQAIDARLAHFGGTAGGAQLSFPLLAGQAYRRVVEDLTGVTPSQLPGLDVETGEPLVVTGADSASALSLPPSVLAGYEEAAAQVAKKVRKVPEDVLLRALRREPSESEKQQFDDGGLRWLLSYPEFLFLVERDASPGAIRQLDEFELATRLAAFLWGSFPDAQLLQLAAAGQLRDRLPAEIKRMLKSESVASGLAASLAKQWLRFPRVRPVRGQPKPNYQELTDEQWVAYRAEVAEFFSRVIRNDGSLIGLLGGRYSFSDGALATTHGLHALISHYPVTAAGVWNREPYDGVPMLAERVISEQSRRFREAVVIALSELSLPRQRRFEDTYAHAEMLRVIRDPEQKISEAVLAVVEHAVFQQRRNPLPVVIVDGGDGIRVEHSNRATTILSSEAADEVHQLTLQMARPLMRVVSEQGGEVKIEQGEKTEGGGFVARLKIPSGQRVALLWDTWASPEWEVGDEVFLPVAYDGEAMNGSYRPALLGAQDGSWTADLRGSGNPRPGTVAEIRCVAIRHVIGRVSAHLSPAMSYHDNLFKMDTARQPSHVPQEFVFVGRRSLAMPPSYDKEMVVVCKSSPAQVLKIEPIRFIRPLLGWSGGEEIDFGRVEKGERPPALADLEITNSQIKSAGEGEALRETLLYGTLHLTPDAEKPDQILCGHVGVELLGADAKRFRLQGGATSEKGDRLQLLGADGEPGLRGGVAPEVERFSLEFLGTEIAGDYQAVLRIATQAGNLGARSTGAEGEPQEGLYYLDIPVRAQVGGKVGALDRIKRLLD